MVVPYRRTTKDIEGENRRRISIEIEKNRNIPSDVLLRQECERMKRIMKKTLDASMDLDYKLGRPERIRRNEDKLENMKIYARDEIFEIVEHRWADREEECRVLISTEIEKMGEELLNGIIERVEIEEIAIEIEKKESEEREKEIVEIEEIEMDENGNNNNNASEFDGFVKVSHPDEDSSLYDEEYFYEGDGYKQKNPAKSSLNMPSEIARTDRPSQNKLFEADRPEFTEPGLSDLDEMVDLTDFTNPTEIPPSSTKFTPNSPTEMSSSNMTASNASSKMVSLSASLNGIIREIGENPTDEYWDDDLEDEELERDLEEIDRFRKNELDQSDLDDKRKDEIISLIKVLRKGGVIGPIDQIDIDGFRRNLTGEIERIREIKPEEPTRTNIKKGKQKKNREDELDRLGKEKKKEKLFEMVEVIDSLSKEEIEEEMGDSPSDEIDQVELRKRNMRIIFTLIFSSTSLPAILYILLFFCSPQKRSLLQQFSR